MKAEAMRAKSADELKEMIMGLRKEQMTLRFQHSGQQVANTAQIKVVRRSIARAKTLLAEQALGAKPAKKSAAPKAAKAASPAKEKAAKPAAKKPAKAAKE